MPEYSIDFSERLIEAANFILNEKIQANESHRTILYLSLLSCEVTIKALLEKAGTPVSKIKSISHRIDKLLDLLGKTCEVEIDVANGILKWLPAMRIRSRSIKIDHFAMSSVGAILDSEDVKLSQYPNEIRYGNTVIYFPPEAMLETARQLLAWAQEHKDTIRLRIQPINTP